MKRKEFIDIAKGIGIILVILGHLNISGQYSRNIIYAFHMPFFFVLSGAFSHTNIGFKQYFVKIFKRLYIPFVVFLVIDTFIGLLIAILKGTNIFSVLLNGIYSLIGFKFNTYNLPLWFLFVLFIIQMAYFWVNKSKILKIIVVVLGCLIVMTSKNIEYIKGCLYIIAIPCFSFYILGDTLKKYIISISEKVNEYTCKYLVISSLFLGILAFCSIKNGIVEMIKYSYGNWGLFFINALAGTYLLLVISAFLTRFKVISKSLSFLGRNSIVILVTHYYICRIILPKVMADLGLYQYLYSYITQGIVLVLVICLMVPTILFANRHLGIIFGKNSYMGKLNR